jgi:hypothetical protein
MQHVLAGRSELVILLVAGAAGFLVYAGLLRLVAKPLTEEALALVATALPRGRGRRRRAVLASDVKQVGG